MRALRDLSHGQARLDGPLTHICRSPQAAALEEVDYVQASATQVLCTSLLYLSLRIVASRQVHNLCNGQWHTSLWSYPLQAYLECDPSERQPGDVYTVRYTARSWSHEFETERQE